MRSHFALLVLPVACFLHPAHSALVHRWSFNASSGNAPAGTTFADSVSAANATVVGVGATLTGTALKLPGSTGNSAVAANTIAAYVDLPNGIISSKTDLTVEIWATIHSVKSNQRLADFGRMTGSGVGTGAATGEVTNDSTTAPSASPGDDLNWNVSRGGNISQQRLESRINATGAKLVDTSVSTTVDAEYHYVLTFVTGAGTSGSTGGQLKWYRNGTLVGTVDLAYRLNSLRDVNNWLGRSQNTNDAVANISYNEVRIYDHAFSEAEVISSRDAGADSGLVPVTNGDTATIHAGQKVRLAVLANDTGNITPSTVEIVQAPTAGTATPASDGRILYANTDSSASGDSFAYRVSGLAGTSAPATVQIQFASGLRIANSTLNVPLAPPATGYQLTNAFSGLTFTSPTTLAIAPGDTKRLFVCQKGGLLRLVPDVTAATPQTVTFLDVAGLLSSRGEAINTASEQGLIGLAFHPDYATNGYFYVFYSVKKSGGSAIYERLSRFTRSASNPNAADNSTELVLIEQLDDATNHNGGDLHFGPDGYLYVSLGDEGNQNDSLNNSQTITKDFFSGVLRIDVDKKAGNLAPNPHAAIPTDSGVARYSVPADNPFIQTSLGGSWNGTYNGQTISDLTTVRTEFWATGMRNPWRMSFDSATGELWVGDVGGSSREEVNVVTKGGNYGWAYREGFTNGPKNSSAPANFDSLYGTRPIYDYRRSGGDANFEGQSITGGRVYRGERFLSLQGAYVFADYVSGNIWTLRRNGATPTVERIAGEGSIVAFGVDPSNGDLLLADYNDNLIRRLVTSAVSDNFPSKLSDTNLFADLTDLSPAPSLLPYDVNLPFWSDHAVKRRWFIIPDGTSKMTWAREGNWTFPTGQIWVKHFDMEMVRGNPATKRRLETRILVKNSTGAYGVSYRWNEAQTEATLVPDEGESFPLEVTVGESVVSQTWQIPSRANCLTCHTPQGGHALSSNTRQINLGGSINGFAGNQVDLLRLHGFFSNEPAPSAELPRHVRANETSVPLEQRVRSYLAVNCAYCHQPGGTAGTAWDARPEVTLAETGLINGEAANNGGDSANKLVVPGSTVHSIVYNRTGALNGFTRMPPIATNQIDQENLALLGAWIEGLAQGYNAWRQNQFGSLVSSEGEPSADPDADDLRNLLEYGLDLSPLTNSITGAPTSQLDGNGRLTLTFRRARADLNYIVQGSNDLVTWEDLAVNPGNVGEFHQFTDAVPPNPRRFLRLKVTNP